MAEAGGADAYHEAMGRSRELHDLLHDDFPTQAQYAVALGYRIRFVMQLNAREAMHVLELRTSPQGHPAYRAVCQEMHRLIAEQAGHQALAEAMSHVDHGTTDGLERLDAERGGGGPPLGVVPRAPAGSAHGPGFLARSGSLRSPSTRSSSRDPLRPPARSLAHLAPLGSHAGGHALPQVPRAGWSVVARGDGRAVVVIPLSSLAT